MKLEKEIKQTEFLNPQHRAGMNIIFTANWLLNEYALALKPLGLSLQQLNALSILKGQPNHTAPVHLVKDRLIDRMPNVSRLLNKLMEKGLVKKDRDHADQRVVFIHLTPEGKKVAEKGRDLFNQVAYKLSDKDAAQLSLLLDSLRK